MKNSPINITVFLLISLLSGFLFAQQEINWETYIIQKEKGPMAITVNMDLNYARPNYKNLLMVGINTTKCQKNGYPTEEGLNKMYKVSDSIAGILETLTKNRLTGIITYQCAGFDIFYLKDTMGVRSELDSFFAKQYPTSKKYLELAYDRNWEYYKNSLYPKKLEEDFFYNHEYLNQLVIKGDDLVQARKVIHYIYFKREKRRQKFVDKIKVLNFQVVSQKYNKGQDLPFELEIVRNDHIDPEAIATLTKTLMGLSRSSYGVYDGWGVEPKVKD